MIFRIAAFALGIAIGGFAGCKQEAPPTSAPKTAGAATTQTEPISFPELGPGRLILPGVQVQEVTLQRGAVPMRVWYYQPEKAADKLALVLVPPAGSTLFVGMALGDGDRAEHYPYVKAGFAVASFEIDGH